MSDPEATTPAGTPARRRYVPAVGPRLRKLLGVVFGLFALLAVNSLYLVSVRVLEAVTGRTYQNWFYIGMFLFHLVLGLLIVVPVIVFGILHLRNAKDRPNRRAVKVGYALFATALVLLASGIVLTRIEGVIVVKDPAVRSVAYWLHVATPLVAAWLFVLHRLAGQRIRWRVGARWAVVAAVFAGVHAGAPGAGPAALERRGAEVGRAVLLPVAGAHHDRAVHPRQGADERQLLHGVPRGRARALGLQRPPLQLVQQPAVPVLGAPDPRHGAGARRQRAGGALVRRLPRPGAVLLRPLRRSEFRRRPRPRPSQAGITCTSCHAITHINSTKGNSDYTIEEPIHYPFAFSHNKALRWVNFQLVKAKPELHKKTFLKPLHRTPEFCSACHKVHLPPELNDYKWLRGQDHYGTYHLSGVSGHGVTSFYYPPKAQAQLLRLPHAARAVGRLRRPRLRPRRRPRGPRPPVPRRQHRHPAPARLPGLGDQGAEGLQRGRDAGRPLRHQGGRHDRRRAPARRCARWCRRSSRARPTCSRRSSAR